jgi:beta-N-acetylhexosaminidase
MLPSDNSLKLKIFAILITILSVCFSSASIASSTCSINEVALARMKLNIAHIQESAPNIIQKPILFDKNRIELTRQYRLEHYGIKSKSITIQPQIIVLHWTCSKNLESPYNTFYLAKLKGRPELAKGGALNVSAHFLVDRDGTIYQLMPDNWMARHTIGLNNIAIGIENVGGVDNREDLTQKQVEANVSLIKHLKAKYPKIKYLIGHYEYGKFRNTKFWQEKDPAYFTTKTDPGKRFMHQVRATLQQSNSSTCYCKT